MKIYKITDGVHTVYVGKVVGTDLIRDILAKLKEEKK